MADCAVKRCHEAATVSLSVLGDSFCAEHHAEYKDLPMTFYARYQWRKEFVA